ncbi:hypothetical protein NTD86_20190 [Pseudomonas sp. 7P_10.2_Bac1]|uniref:NEL-type E3 ubiquitin ligase domain-containing protein n=1 Tax=Pseudomonas sp. 7P_10.2_Bac1 TaxID=2971614 RepID=UPI0021C8677D|nr:NEL-type E3 ubiquitin ligase domain-containing protein [Pseudomonas sp. 7P_10.2_Bac1]MCU1729298.1 hypothetical protein [Pseudomonas sp. 7P_10.2_Bac1]
MPLPDHDAPASPFLTATQWAEHAVLEHLHQSVSSQFASLTDAEQRRYRHLAQQYATATKDVEREDQSLKDAFQAQGVARIRERLLAVTGKDLDPLKVYIHTRYLHTPQRTLQWPQRARRSPSTVEGEPRLPEPLARLDEGTPMAHVLSMTLWEAACMNFGFLAYFASYRSDSLVNASFINLSPGVGFRTAQVPENIDTTSLIPVQAFIDAARSLNLGEELQLRIIEKLQFSSTLQSLMRTQTAAHLQFSLMEFYRSCGPNPQKRAAVQALSTALNSGSTALTVSQIVLTIKFTPAELLSGHGFHPQRGFSVSTRPAPTAQKDAGHFIIPFYQLELPGTKGVFSFFPGRPKGELRWHGVPSQVIADFREQLLKDRADNKLDWFHVQLSEELKDKLITVVPQPAGAGTLGYTIPGQLPPLRREWIAFDDLGFKVVSDQNSLELPLFYYQCGLYANRALQLAQEKSAKDWQDLVSAVSTLFDELAALLLIPIPGAVKGLSRVIQLLFLGSTAQEAFSALEQSSRGDHSGGAQLLLDALDILVTPLLNRKAGTVAQLRHAKMLQQMGQPRTFTRVDGRTDLWQSDVALFTLAPSSVTDHMVLDEQGIYRQAGHDYVFLEKDGQRHVVEVERNTDGTWRAIAKVDPNAYRPPVVWDETQRRWQLALDDSQGLSDSQLLCRMVSGMTAQVAQRALDISAVSRADLQRLWAGDHAPSALTDAVTRFQADTQLQRCIQGLNQYGQSPAILEGPVLSLMPSLEYWPKGTLLMVLDSSETFSEVYGQVAYPAGSRNGVILKRLDDGELVTTTSLPLRAFPDDLLTDVIKQLSLPTDRLQMSQQLASQLNVHKDTLFTALTVGKDELTASGITEGLVEYRPTVAVSPVVLGLRSVHPGLSMARCHELLRLYPDLARHLNHLSDTLQRHALLRSRRLPKPLHDAVFRAVFSARVERLLDAVYHPRAFNQDVDQWFKELCASKLKQWLDVELIVYTEAENVVAGAGYEKYRKNELVLIDQGAGTYSAYDMQHHTVIPAVSGPDSFLAAVIAGLGTSTRIQNRLGAVPVTVSGWREVIGNELVAQRTPAGFIDPAFAQVERYALTGADIPSEWEPNAKGIHPHNNRPRIALDFQCYDVESPTLGRVNAIIDSSRFGRAPIPLYGNDQGSWRHHYEQPLEWDGLYLLKRLGHSASGFNSDEMTGILHVSNTTDDMLRRVHVNREPIPALLVDTLARFRHAQRLKALLIQRDQNVDRSLFSAITEAFDRNGRTGLMATLTPSQLAALQQSIRPDDTYADLLSHTPSDVRYVHALYHYLVRSTGGMTPALFEAVAQVSENQPGPSVALIKRVFPGLPACIASELVRSANQAETLQLTEQGRVPLRIGEEARWYLRELRVNRAIEGFYLPALQNNDSVRLMLHSLGTLAGWSATVRVQAREGSVNGALIGHLGPDNGTVQLTLVNTTQGWQEGSVSGRDVNASPQDFFTVLMAALPDAERQALGDAYPGGAELLKEKLIVRVIKDRDQVYSLLGMVAKRPWFAPPKRFAGGRIGYALSGRGQASGETVTEPELVRRYQNIYPASGEFEATQAFAQMRERNLNVVSELSRLKDEATKLLQDLDAWVAQRTDLEGYNSAAQAQKQAMAQALSSAWRKESRGRVDLSGNSVGYALALENFRVPTLPVLSAQFSHVVDLSMLRLEVGAGMAFVDANNIEQFLGRFGALTSLKIERCDFTHLPQAIEQLSGLTQLAITDNIVRLRLRRQELAMISGLVHLQALNLRGCVLPEPLDVSRLTQLRTLNLASTHSQAWPSGVLQLSRLTDLDLSNNLITQIPPEVFTAHWRINNGTHLAGNPLSAAALQQLRDFPFRPRVNFGLHLDADHPPAQSTFDHLVWLDGLASEKRAPLSIEVQSLEDLPRSESFFTLIDGLKSTQDFVKDKDDLVRRVQTMLKAAAHHETLRDSLFDLAEEPRQCCDSLALMFSRLETQVLVFEALADGDPARTERNLARLVRGQFRVHQLDRLAAEYTRKKKDEGEVLDELEVALSYRLALTQALQLPAQPKNMKFSELGKLDDGAVVLARDAVLAMDTNEQMLAYMTEDRFWVDFLEKRYAQPFSALKEKFRQPLAQAMEQGEDHGQAVAVDWAHERKALLTKLTRQALSQL